MKRLTNREGMVKKNFITNYMFFQCACQIPTQHSLGMVACSRMNRSAAACRQHLSIGHSENSLMMASLRSAVSLSLQPGFARLLVAWPSEARPLYVCLASHGCYNSLVAASLHSTATEKASP